MHACERVYALHVYYFETSFKDGLQTAVDQLNQIRHIGFFAVLLLGSGNKRRFNRRKDDFRFNVFFPMALPSGNLVTTS